MQRSDLSKSEEKNVSRAAGVVSFFTFLSRILGLVRDMVIAAFFGTGMVADAFVVAFRIPNLLRRLFAEGSLTIAFIPVFTEYLTSKSKEDALEMARVVLTILSLILAIVTLLGVIFSPWVVRLQAFGFGASGDKYELTVLLTRITFPYIFLVSLVAFFMGVLNSLRRFAAPAAAPIFLNVGIVGAAYLISPYLKEPIVGIAIGVIIGGIIQVGLQIPWVLREGMKLFPVWQPGHPAVKQIGLLMLPAVFGSAVYQLNSFIGTLLASFLVQGSVSWLYFADRLVQLPLGVFAIAIGTALLPSLSTQAANKDLNEFGDTLTHALRLVFFITLPATVGLIILGKPIFLVLFQRGAFDATSTLMTNKALFYYALGLWAVSGLRIVVPAFYALQDTKTPVKVAVVALVVNLIAGLCLMGPLKHGGIALALSVSASVQFCLLLFLIKRKIALANLSRVLVSVLKSAFVSVVMGLGVFYLHSRWLIIDPAEGLLSMIFNLSVLVGAGVVIYFGAARILGCSELASVQEMFLPFLKKLRSSRN
ncbi:MAG: murein biosynthesis integral membrane protein MurJ [Deltaproteobacteria bacterium]|nr:murein biosynthesis integral membrane protein MurJ [Deltaproteobacteria bacterium]